MTKGQIVDRKPETMSAYLVNAALRRATLHEFERAEVQPLLRGDNEVGVAFLYRCVETGELRRWGMEYTGNERRRLQ